MKKIQLYIVFYSLNRNGFKTESHLYEGRETESCYIVGISLSSVAAMSKPEKRVNKHRLLKPDTKINNSHDLIMYYTWCLPGDLEKAKEIVKNKVIETATKIRHEAEAVFIHLDNQ